VPITVCLTDGVGEDGAPVELPPIETMCSFDEKQRQILDAQRRMVTLEGTVLFPGDLAPDVAVLAGTVSLLGRRWDIHRGARARNPDGTVNYTKLELM
jgi:hypothetical protein